MIKNLTLKLLDKVILEVKKIENKKHIEENILDPIISYIYIKLFNSFLTIIILFIIITFFSIVNFIILINIFMKKK